MSTKFHKTDTGSVTWYCPGCEEYHMAHVEKLFEESKRPIWGWNGSLDKPTLTPSVKVTTGREYKGKNIRQFVCHVFIKDGQIQFLSDCSHEYAGKTVEIPDWDLENT